jgi:prophage DNA circulation protein
LLIEPFSEKYLKKVIKKLTGNNEIEDALKRLDRLTQEEARMVSAQLLKVTNTIDNRVEEIADDMLGVDNRVAGIGDQVQGVDDKVTAVMNGAQSIFYLLS